MKCQAFYRVRVKGEIEGEGVGPYAQTPVDISAQPDRRTCGAVLALPA